MNSNRELSLYDGCILCGNSVVVPPNFRYVVLTELHDGHPGMAKMKGLARMYVWWPDTLVRKYNACQLQQSIPAPAPLQPWKWPTPDRGPDYILIMPDQLKER